MIILRYLIPFLLYNSCWKRRFFSHLLLLTWPWIHESYIDVCILNTYLKQMSRLLWKNSHLTVDQNWLILYNMWGSRGILCKRKVKLIKWTKIPPPPMRKNRNLRKANMLTFVKFLRQSVYYFQYRKQYQFSIKKITWHQNTTLNVITNQYTH